MRYIYMKKLKVETWQKIVQPIITWNFLPNFKRRALPGQWCMLLQQFPNNRVTTQHAVSNHYFHTSNISINHGLHSSTMHRKIFCTYKQIKHEPKTYFTLMSQYKKNQQNHQMIPFQSFILINCHTFCYK